jgi:hypothetical protein
MSMTCTVCPHEKRRDIDMALISGERMRTLAHRYGLSRDAMGRHRSCIAAAFEKADKRIGGRIALRVEGLITQLERMATEAQDQKQAAAFLLVARELRPTYELGAKLNGEMQAASVAGFLAALGVQSESEVRDALHLARSAHAPSLEECREEGVALLRMVLVERPAWREGVMEELAEGMGLLREQDAENGNGNVYE